jgi:alkanesulfonate monooxygenase SsuD/methylene tetrahydromethanopterin reductase-like flavin-dependent oxidoreductase (luciferase family)
MLKIGVCLPHPFEDVGEYLADARALDAAGVASLWLDDGGHDPWMVLSGIAAVTGVARLVVSLTDADARLCAGPDTRLATLERLSRGRGVICVTPADGVEVVIDFAQRAKTPVLVQAPGEAQMRIAARLADGLVRRVESPEMLRTSLTPVSRLREAAGRTGPFEVWARVAALPDPTEWRRVRQEYEDAGATGVIVPADPRLLDLLRNGDEEDDRSDLQLAQG